MATDNWYRNTTWDSNIEAEFEARLKRSKQAFHQAQYLRIQASCLLDSSELEIQSVGVRQMERLFSEYPTEEFSVIHGQEQLGDYYFKVGDFHKAEKYFRLVVNYTTTKFSRSGTSAKAELKLAATILGANSPEKLDEAYILCKNYPITELTLNSDMFFYAELVAHICARLNKSEEAMEFAKMAIDLAKFTESQFYRHQNVGLVNANEKQLAALERIAFG